MEKSKENDYLDEQLPELEKVCRVVMEYLAENWDPHTSLTIDCTSAKLVVDKWGIRTFEYLKD